MAKKTFSVQVQRESWDKAETVIFNLPDPDKIKDLLNKFPTTERDPEGKEISKDWSNGNNLLSGKAWALALMP